MAVVPAVVPQSVQAAHAGGTNAVDLVQKSRLRFFTVIFPCHLNPQCFVDQILLGCHDIDQVSEGLRRMRGSINVHMNVM